MELPNRKRRTPKTLKIRSKADQDNEDVGALRLELDHEFMEAIQPESLISALMSKVTTLRRDTNALRESQSPPPARSSERHLTDELLTVLKPEAPGDIRRRAYNIPNRRVTKTMRQEPRRIRKQQAAPMEMNILGRKNYASIESDSSDGGSD